MSTAEKVLDTMKLRITNGFYEPGCFLQVNRISEELLVSPAPVREALIRLHERSLLDWNRNRGFSVSITTINDVDVTLQLCHAIYRNAILRNGSRNIGVEPSSMKCAHELPTPEYYKYKLRAFQMTVVTKFEYEIITRALDRIWQAGLVYRSKAEFIEFSIDHIDRTEYAFIESDNEAALDTIDDYFTDGVKLIKDMLQFI